MQPLKFLDKTIIHAQAALSHDGQVIVGNVRHECTAIYDEELMLHNRVSNNTLSFSTLFGKVIPNGFKFTTIALTPYHTNLWGNVILGMGCLESFGNYTGWRAFIPRYDILDYEGIFYQRPVWRTEFKPKR